MGAWIYFKTKVYEWNEERCIRAYFYHNACFQRADCVLKREYRDQNPYRMSIQYLKEQNAEDLYTYGETPLTTMAHIVQEFEITAKDRVIEMGSGRGRAALFLSEFVGCKVRAYEIMPVFVQKLKRIEAPNLEVLKEDMFLADFSWASVIFLYGTMLKEEEIHEMALFFPKKVKIITVSYSLSEYSDLYQTKKTVLGNFPWGKTKVYWNERIS